MREFQRLMFAALHKGLKNPLLPREVLDKQRRQVLSKVIPRKPFEWGRISGSKFMKAFEERLSDGSRGGATFLAQDFGWGLCSQRVVDDAVKPFHDAHMHTILDTRVDPDSASVPRLLQVVGGKKKLEDGVKRTYYRLLDHFNIINKGTVEVGPVESWEELDVATPELAALLDYQSLMYDAVGMRSGVFRGASLEETVQVKVEMLAIWMEEGFGSKSGRKEHQRQSKDARRIVSAFRIDSNESVATYIFDLKEPDMEPEFESVWDDMVMSGGVENVHFWVLETDFKEGRELDWRIRNINDAVKPKEGKKIPFV